MMSVLHLRMFIYMCIEVGPEKNWQKVYGTIILQPFIRDLCSFQQSERTCYMTKASVWIQQLNIFVLQLASELFKNNINLYIFIREQVRDRNSLCQSHFPDWYKDAVLNLSITKKWTTNDSHLDWCSIAPSTISWLIMSQQPFKTCFRWWTLTVFWHVQ